MLRKLVISTFITLSITAPVQAQPAPHGTAIPVGVQQTKNQGVERFDQLAELRKPVNCEEQKQPLAHYGLPQVELPKHVGIPAEVFPASGSPYATPVGILEIKLPQVGKTLNELQLDLENEALPTGSEFDRELNRTMLLKTHYPRTYNGVPQDIQKIIDQGTALSGEAASR
jgi:hypothetical protein